MNQQAMDKFIASKKCQEASSLSRETYIPCAYPAVAVVANADPQPYYMCHQCAHHNVHNRGGVLIAVIETYKGKI